MPGTVSPGGPGLPGPHQAACCMCARAGARCGARACKPRCVRIRSITADSRIAAMIVRLVAAVRAVLEVDLEDALEQPGPADANRPGVCAAWLSGVELRRVGILVGTCRDHQRPQLGRWAPSTPWKRIRRNLGRGTGAARRCMNVSGDITMWVVPSRHAVSSSSTTCPAALHCTR